MDKAVSSLATFEECLCPFDTLPPLRGHDKSRGPSCDMVGGLSPFGVSDLSSSVLSPSSSVDLFTLKSRGVSSTLEDMSSVSSSSSSSIPCRISSGLVMAFLDMSLFSTSILSSCRGGGGGGGGRRISSGGFVGGTSGVELRLVWLEVLLALSLLSSSRVRSSSSPPSTDVFSEGSSEFLSLLGSPSSPETQIQLIKNHARKYKKY